MTAVEEALRQLVLADGTVSGLVGTRVYPDNAPQNVVAPFVIVTRVDGIHDHNLTSSSGYLEVRDQFDCYAAGKKAAQNLAEAIRLVLDDYRGTVTVGADDVVIQDCRLDSDQTAFVPRDDFSDDGLYRVTHDYITAVEETIATH